MRLTVIGGFPKFVVHAERSIALNATGQRYVFEKQMTAGDVS